MFWLIGSFEKNKYISNKPLNDKIALASKDPNGDPKATPSICLYKILLNIKYNSFVAKDKGSLNSQKTVGRAFLKYLYVNRQFSSTILSANVRMLYSLNKADV